MGCDRTNKDNQEEENRSSNGFTAWFAVRKTLSQNPEKTNVALKSWDYFEMHDSSSARANLEREACNIIGSTHIKYYYSTTYKNSRHHIIPRGQLLIPLVPWDRHNERCRRCNVK